MDQERTTDPLEISCDDEHTVLLQPDFDETKGNAYEETLTASKRTVAHLFVSGIVYSFFNMSRLSIYILYADSLGANSTQLALLLYCSWFWSGITTLLYASMGNKWGYDTMLVALLILQCIAVLMEALAQSFWVLFVGTMTGQVGIFYVLLAAIASR